MKIIHCCLASFYIDNFSYQENILPKLHKQLGHEVYILASTETYKNNILDYIQPCEYFNEHNILVNRLSYIKWLPLFITKKIRVYNNLYKIIMNIKPDIIYLHDCQFLSIFEIKKYAKKFQVKIIIDSHTDYINSAKSFFSYYFLHKILYRFCVNVIEEYTTIFWATLPIRKTFLIEMYGVNESKIKFLPFGADDTLFNFSDLQNIKTNFRNTNSIALDDFIIVTGGKIDSRKNIILLINTFLKFINDYKINNFKLLIFGRPSVDISEEFNNIINNKNIKYLDWVASNEIHKIFLSSDLAIFPGTHSVHWEEAIGLGIPCVFKKWDGMTHLDLGGNCILLDEINSDSIIKVFRDIIFKEFYYTNLKKSAINLGPKNFSYSKIASQAINC